MTDRFRIHPNGQPWLATPRPGEGRAHPRGSSDRGAAGLVGTGAPNRRTDDRLRPSSDGWSDTGRSSAVPYRQAHPMFAHPVAPAPEPYPSRGTADLKALAVILLIVLAASLAGVRLS